MRVLVTRPSFEAERTAEALGRKGHIPVFAPMLSIKAVDATIGTGPWAGIVMTSGNAARAIAGHPKRDALRHLPVYAVGKQTSRAAGEAGFGLVTSAEGDGADLVRLIRETGPRIDAPYLYLAGNDRARDLAAELAGQGIKVETIVVYRAEPATALPEATREGLARNEIGGVLHYSRRTAATFCDCVASAGLASAIQATVHYCLSSRAAEPLAAAGVKDVRVAARPDEDALLELLPIV